jgi:hypothetical protein
MNDCKFINEFAIDRIESKCSVVRHLDIDQCSLAVKSARKLAMLFLSWDCTAFFLGNMMVM